MGEVAGGPFDEAALVERYRQGDGPALEALVARYEGLLRSRILKGMPRSLRQRVSVQDVMQETRIAAYESRTAFEPRGEGSFLRWVMGIAENRVRRAVARHALAARRAVGREVPREKRPESGQFVGRGPSPSQEAIAGELEELAREALESLLPEEQEILRLTRDEHLPLTGAAARMGITKSAAGRLFGRALPGFRAALDRLRGESQDSARGS